ncbi:hypothetical protein KY314_00975 [Candidatus Woesearchaeota archaeon]|nr:hypothetical protein [Candidatus Woesearchaeota archaeon]
MATLLDMSIISKFDAVFPFLLILLVTYAVLSKIEIFKERQATAGIIAFIIAVMTLMSPIATKTINMMAPWFILFLTFGIFLLIGYQALGVPESSIKEILTDSPYSKTIIWWIIVIAVIIGIGSLATVLSQREATITQETTEEAAPTEYTGFWQIITNPKVVGVALIFLIAMFTISRLAGVPPEAIG